MEGQVEKEAECPICVEILKKSIQILNCGHILRQGYLHDLITSTQQNR